MGKNKKYLFIGMVWSIIRSIEFVRLSDKQEGIAAILIQFGFDKPHFTTGYLTLILYNLFPILMFQMIFGIRIYKHFVVANAYYFSRVHNKDNWYRKEVATLLIESLVYNIFYYGTATILLYVANKGSLDGNVFYVLLYSILYSWLYTFTTTLLINLLAIRLGSHNSFILVYSIQLISIASLLVYDERFPLHGFLKMLFQLNPISNLILSWHSTGDAAVNSMIHIHNIDFPLLQSILYFIVIGAMITAFGIVLIKKVDIALDQKEVQG
ncbi:hypothetical protein [Anaerosporobacter faecicola]|uniref:hypothetical protein n=1 Tax=Anaerosporobacter faecicola TaxID=2718714 RepID=UPI00143A8231|nr:hypothetical protein [Anaerosporobacter faecicola]